MLERLLRRVTTRLRRIALSPRRWVSRHIVPTSTPLIHLGSNYGGWTFVHQEEIAGAVNVLCGAGEDLSFDLALQGHYDCQVVIVDPTPRAIHHWRHLRANVGEHRPCTINQGPELYDVEGVDFDKICFLPYAIWTEDKEVAFWTPSKAAHVSHSIINLQDTRDSITVDAKTLPSLMALAGSTLPIGVLKLDIEGAAADVLEALLSSDLRPLQILAEFEELNFPTANSFTRFRALIRRLREIGYCIVAFDGSANITFRRVVA